MRFPRLALLGTAAGLVLACGESAEEPSEAAPAATPIAGMYEVSGVTVETSSGTKRPISGTIILADDGDSYTATFNLHTTFSGAGQGIAAEIIGMGSGTIDGRSLTGTAETQIVMATVPGVDPGFAFIPRMTSTRIVSTSTTTVAADGTVSIEIKNEPAAGEEYARTHTTMRGRRVPGPGEPVADSAGPRTR